MAGSDSDRAGHLCYKHVPTQTEIGNRVGLAREAVGRIMAGLSQQNIFKCQGRTLVIQNLECLNGLALIY